MVALLLAVLTWLLFAPVFTDGGENSRIVVKELRVLPAAGEKVGLQHVVCSGSVVEFSAVFRTFCDSDAKITAAAELEEPKELRIVLRYDGMATKCLCSRLVRGVIDISTSRGVMGDLNVVLVLEEPSSYVGKIVDWRIVSCS